MGKKRMANPQHLDLLKQGADVWKTWRQENPKEHPDLSEADLHENDLSGFDLSEAKLDNTILTGANLQEINLK